MFITISTIASTNRLKLKTDRQAEAPKNITFLAVVINNKDLKYIKVDIHVKIIMVTEY